MAEKEDKSTKKDDEDLHAEGLRIHKVAIDRDSDNRTRYQDDVRFARLAEQWPEEVRKKRQTDGRPCLTINRMAAFIRQVVNDARQNSPQIKFHAVGEGADQWTAKVLDGVAKNIEYSSNAEVAYDTAADNAVTGGFGYFRITTDYAADDVFDQDIRIERIANSLSVVPDPYCMDADSANWNDAFITETYSLDTFRKKWPDADASSFEGDRKDVAPDWLDGDDVMVAEWWTRREVAATLLQLSNGMVMLKEQYEKAKELLDIQGVTIQATRPTRTMKVTQHIMNGCEIIETNEWAGKYIPIVPVYGDEVIIDGKRHLKSLIHDAKDAQRMLNYWRTASTELVALAPKAPWVGPVGSFATDPNWATANNENHQFLEYDPVPEANGMPPQRQAFTGPPAGALQEAMNASDDMKSIMGLFDASMGAQSNETSGRAILARQREGDVSTFNFTDNLNRAIRHAGRIICDLIPKVYSTARIIRTIREDGSSLNVPVNQQIQQPGKLLPEHAKALGEQTEGILHVYDLTTGKYDVTCESGPSYTTQREEAAAQMMNFIQAYPPAAQVIGPMLAKNLDWPGSDEIADALKALLPPQLQGQNPQLMQAQQVIQQLQQAMGQLKQQVEANQQDKAIDVAKVKIDAYKAETDRIQAVGAGMGPAEVQALVMQTLQQVLTSPDISPGAPSIPANPGAPMPPQGMPPGPAPEQFEQHQFQSPPAQPGQPQE
jgi:hypothetical protein